ncbi:hypothetical protein V8F20_010581 [Naviculisporaceae sp. PSN 640]
MSAIHIHNEGISGVADKAVRNLESVRAARHEIYGAVEPLDGIESEAVRLIRLLTLVKDVQLLQTPAVGHQAFDAMDLGARLTASMSLIGAENRRRPEPKVLRSGDPEYTHLQTMEGQMKETRVLLGDLVSSVHVGLRGNPRDGFAVERQVLLEANDKVKRASGANLLLYSRLRHKLEDNKDLLVQLDDDDAVGVGLPRVSGTMVQEWLDNVRHTC